jgi:hypothetical protein
MNLDYIYEKICSKFGDLNKLINHKLFIINYLLKIIF